MLFMTYRPRSAKGVKAEQISVENIEAISATFFGMAVVVLNEHGILSLKIATLDGVIVGELNDWVVRSDSGISVMSDVEFNKMYEKARTTREA